MTFSDAAKQIEASANTATPMPLYRCHKEVWALRIVEVIPAPKPTIEELDRILNGDEGTTDVGAILVVEGHFAPIAVTRDFIGRHQPQAGGYYVVYKDGYKSFSPATAFEQGYTRV
jgi:hypothetical protein